MKLILKRGASLFLAVILLFSAFSPCAYATEDLLHDLETEPVAEQTKFPTEDIKKATEPTETETSFLDGIECEADTLNAGNTYPIEIIGQSFCPSARYFYYDCPGYPDHAFDCVQFRRITVNGVKYPAYCLVPGKPAGAGNYEGVEAGADGNWNYDLPYEMSFAQQQAIGLILLYGYPNKLTPSNQGQQASYEIATQLLIWEIVIGIRDPDTLECSNYGLRDSFTPACAFNGWVVRDVRKTYDQIEADIQKHGLIPSFSTRFNTAGTPTHTMVRQSNGTYAITLTDTNNILDEYTFTDGNGLTFVKNGNTLTITSTKPLTNPSVIAPTKNIPNLDNASFLVLTSTRNDQTNLCLANGAQDDPVPAYFKLKTASGDIVGQKSTNTGRDLSGWTVHLYSGTTLIATTTTDRNGRFEFLGLEPGTYMIVEEIPANATYECTNNYQTVVVTNGETVNVTLHNQQKKGHLQVTKITNTGEHLGGWSVNLYNIDKQLMYTFTVPDNGILTIQNLDPGTYYVQEVGVTDPFWICDTEMKEALVLPVQTTAVTINNVHKAEAWIQKRTNTGENLGNWQFGIYSDAACTTQVATLTSDDNGNAKTYLLPGTYWVKEIGPAVNGTAGKFWTLDTAVKKIELVAGQTTTVEFENIHHGIAKIIKETNTKDNLDGWTFGIYSDATCKTLVKTLTSEKNGEVWTYIEPGTYWVKEIRDNQNRFDDDYWTVDTAIRQITVEVGKETSVTFTNTHRGLAKITKQTNTGKDLDGWQFSIYRDRNRTELVTTLTSDVNGESSTYIEPGTYWIKESGDTKNRFEDELWEIDEKVQQVKITAGETAEISFKNIHHGIAEIIKKTNTGENLDGWKFGIYADNECSELIDTLTSDENGKAQKILEPGTYWVKEIGDTQDRFDNEYWIIDKTVYEITVSAGETATVNATNNHLGVARVKKVTNTGTDLDGWEYGLFADEACTEQISTLVTDASGNVEMFIEPGTYWVKEIGDTQNRFDDIFWVVDIETKKIVVKPGEISEVVFNNVHKGIAEIIKKVNTGKDMEGWTFGIYSDSTCLNLVGTLTSETNGTVRVYIDPGTYWIKEIGDTTGRYGNPYWVMDTRIVEISVRAGEISTVEFYNEHLGAMAIKKTIRGTANENLAGWNFRVVRLADNLELGTFTTDANGFIHIEKLHPGAYLVEEIILPGSVYQCVTENPVTVMVVSGETAEVSFVNELIPTTPKTGDDRYHFITLCTVIFVMSGCAVFCLIADKKKKVKV